MTMFTKVKFAQQLLVENTNAKFQRNLSSTSGDETCGRTNIPLFVHFLHSMQGTRKKETLTNNNHCIAMSLSTFLNATPRRPQQKTMITHTNGDHDSLRRHRAGISCYRRFEILSNAVFKTKTVRISGTSKIQLTSTLCHH
jgi:hypothetical protein